MQCMPRVSSHKLDIHFLSYYSNTQEGEMHAHLSVHLLAQPRSTLCFVSDDVVWVCLSVVIYTVNAHLVALTSAFSHEV